MKIFLRIFLSLVLVLVLVTSLAYFDVIHIPVIKGLLEELNLPWADNSFQEDLEEYMVEVPNAEVYFQGHSQVLTVTDAKKSENVFTESEVAALLADRGFNSIITTDYKIDGSYIGASALLEPSTEKHPIYQTTFLSQDEELWEIYIIDGDIFANPVSFNIQSAPDIQILVAESDEVTSYDCTSNTFYKTIPDPSTLIVQKVSSIDAETLHTITLKAEDIP